MRERGVLLRDRHGSGKRDRPASKWTGFSCLSVTLRLLSRSLSSLSINFYPFLLWVLCVHGKGLDSTCLTSLVCTPPYNPA